VIETAWIESYQEIGSHPKVTKAARKFNISLPAIIGHPHFLWWWAYDHASDGNLTDVDSQDVANADGWRTTSGYSPWG
jgi:hypothetical protein